MTRPQTRIDFWLDPGCPFTWRTSRWLEPVAAHHAIAVDWRLMSLAVLNDNKDVPAAFRDLLAQSWRPVRLLAAARAHGVLRSRPHRRASQDQALQLLEALSALSAIPSFSELQRARGPLSDLQA